MVTVYHYPNCSTCRKARKWLEAEGVEHDLVNLVESPPSAAELGRILELAEVPFKKLFNTSGVVYREGGYKDRLQSMTQDEALASLATNGKLIKRPILLADDFALVGFKADAYAQRLP